MEGNIHIGILVIPMAVWCLLTMTDTLAARVTHRMRKNMYNHTGVAYMTRKEAVATFRA